MAYNSFYDFQGANDIMRYIAMVFTWILTMAAFWIPLVVGAIFLYKGLWIGFVFIGLGVWLIVKA